MKNSVAVFFLFIITCIHYGEVVNKNIPSKGNWDLRMKLVWVNESAGEDVFGEIQNLAVDSRGRVFVADMKNSLIFIFNNNGNFIKRFGKKGEGPGEIREYFGGDQLYVINDTVIFADRTRIHYFDSNGNYARSAMIPSTMRVRGFVNGHTIVSAPATVDDRKKEPEKILVYDLNTEKSTVISSFRPFDKATATEENSDNQVTVGIVIGDITPLMMVYCRDNRIYYGMSSTYKLNVCDTGGKSLLSFSNPGKKPNPVSVAYKKELKESLKEIPENFVKSIINGLPDSASFFSGIHVDSRGNIYLFESDPDSRSAKGIDVYDQYGNFTYRTGIQVNRDTTINTFLITEDSLYIASEDEEGTVAVSRYSIDLPQ